MSSGSTPWLLAVGVIIWLASAAVTLTGFFRSRHERPGLLGGRAAVAASAVRESLVVTANSGKKAGHAGGVHGLIIFR
jgi:hypothetical protein